MGEARHRRITTLSGGEQKRFALELLLRGPDEVLLLDEPDNYLDVPGKRWLETRLRESPKSVLYVSHDRELLARTAQQVVTVEAGSAWTHPEGFASWYAARVARHARFDELRRRWDEERAKLERLVVYYKVKAAHNDGMASRLQAARTRLAKFLEAGPPPEKAARAVHPHAARRRPHRQARGGVRAAGARRADLPVRPRSVVRRPGGRAGRNGTGKSHFLRLLARGGTDPSPAPCPRAARRCSRSRTRAWRGWVPACGPGTSRRPTTARS